MKTTELTGPALDWAVAKCEGKNFTHTDTEYSTTHDTVWQRGGTSEIFKPSTNWSQGGPIIERERIDLFVEKRTPKAWVASVASFNMVGWRKHQYGPTPLIAAMRCFCASKLGDEVEVPDELL